MDTPIIPTSIMGSPNHTFPVAYCNPVLERDFPDPGLLKVDDWYYAYATNSGGVHVQVARSANLVHWEYLGEALPELPRWAVQRFKFTWAPTVIGPGEAGEFIMYYVTRYNWGWKGIQAIGQAVAGRPEGPFFPTDPSPTICQKGEGGSIDPFPFQDEDGTRYLLWKNDGNSRCLPTFIYTQRLSADGLHLEGKPARILAADLGWEGSLVEAPALWKHAGRYYLFYSANAFKNARYAIGWAVAEAPGGPFRKSPTPLLETDPSRCLFGPGGQEVVRGPEGDDWLLFHSWHEPAHIRTLSLARLAWDGERPVVILPEGELTA